MDAANGAEITVSTEGTFTSGDLTADNSDITITSGDDTVTGLMDAANGADITVTTDGTFNSGNLTADASDITITSGDDTVTGLMDAVNGAEITVSTEGAFTSGNLTADASDITITSGDDTVTGLMDAVNGAEITVSTEGTFTSGDLTADNSDITITSGDDTVTGLMDAANGADITVTTDGTFNSGNLTADASNITITSGGNADISRVEAVKGASVSVDAGGSFTTETINASNTGTSVTVTADGAAELTDLIAADSAEVNLYTAGDITLDTVDIEDAIVTITSLNDGNGAAHPDASGINGGGKLTVRYVEADRSRLEIDVWDDLRIFDETNDTLDQGDLMKNVLVLRDMNVRDKVGTTSEVRGAFLTSRNGAVDSTHDDYNVYTAEDGSAYFLQDGQWFVLESSSTGHRFVKLEGAPDLTGYTDRGKYSLYIGTSDTTSPNYNQSYDGILILERSGDFYRIGTDGIEKENHLSEDFIDAQKLLNVGARNYYDSWLTDNADLTVSAKGDIQIRDSLQFTNNSNAELKAGGGIIVADYYMDTDGDGIGDKLQSSRYLVKNSVSELAALGGDVRTDRVFVETSFAAIEDCTGDVNSKTWYILGSKFPIHLDGDVNVVSLDGTDADATPAVQILWSNEDFHIYVRVGDTFEYIRTGVDITSENGGIHIETMDGDKSSSNTLDLYAVAATVNIQAAKDVKIPELELNVPNDSIKLDDGLTPAGANVYHERIYKLLNGQYIPMTETDIPDPAEHAYGTVMNITSSNGGFQGNHIQIDGALTPAGDVYQAHGISKLNMEVAGDIDVIFNLSGRTDEHIAQYGENIADRALTVLNGSKVKLHSTKGAVTVLDPNGDGSVEDILLKGTETENARLQLIGDDSVATGSILAQDAELYLRTTGTEEDAAANDILVDRILGTDVLTELDSAGNIQALHDDANLFVKLEGDVSLRLSATLDIGTPEKVAYIDVPCTIVVDNVTDLYADLNLRDTDGNRVAEEIKEYAVTQGYLAADAESMVQKLIGIGREDYLGNADLRFYNILLTEETLEQIREALELDEEEILTADDLITGFAKLDEQIRNEILNALYDAAVSDGQGLEEIEAELSAHQEALQAILAEKQKLAEELAGDEKPLEPEGLEKLRQRYEELLLQENNIRERINELNDRKADIQDRFQDYVDQDPEMDAMLDQAQQLYTEAQQLNAESEQFTAQAQAIRTALDALLTKLTEHSAFSEESLSTARRTAEVVLKAAQTVAEKAESAERAALEQAIASEEESREEAIRRLETAASTASAMDEFAAEAFEAENLLKNTFVDIPARESQIIIGEIEGELYLNNEGNISLKVDSNRPLTSAFDSDPAAHIRVEANDVLVGQIQSRRGDVSIENVTGGIAAKTLDAGEVNILADEITLKALGSIGSAEQPLVTEQRDVTPSKISGTVEEIYQGQKAEETVSGAALPGKGIIGIQLAQRYEELTDETEQVTVTLLMADGSELQTGMNLQDLRELTKQANTTDGNVYNFLTDASGSNAALQIVVRYDWVRYLDPEAGTRTDAESETGSIYLKENTGKLNIGQIKAAEDIFLSAPDGVYSVLTEEEIASGKQNIHASGENAQVTVDAGTGGLGTGDNPLRVQVSGDNAVMNSTSEDGIYLRGTGDLNLRFEDLSRHVEIELIAADNPGDIANLTVNDLTKGGADVLTGYTKSLGSLELHTEADVGTAEVPFEIVTDASKGGTLILTGNNVNILQQQGDLLAEHVKAEGDLRAEIGGCIVDASDSELTQLLKEYREQLAAANAQQEKLDALKAEWNAIMNNDAEVKREQELNAARENAAKERAEHAEAVQNRQDALDSLKEAEKLLSETIRDGSEAEIEAAREAVEQAKQNLEESERALEQAKAELEKAENRLQKAEDIEAKFEHLQQTKDDLADAYESGNAGKINSALNAYNDARKDTAPYTDYVKRAESDKEIAEQILKDAFGDNFREKLENESDEVRGKYQPLIDMLDDAQAKLDQAYSRLDELNGDAETSGSIAQAQKDLDDKKQVLDELIEQIRDAQKHGGLAIQTGGNADIQAGGSISGSTEDPDDYVGIQVGGQLNAESDGDNRFVSPGDLDIGSAQNNGNRLEIIALGNVTVGTTDADEFSGAGDNIHVNLEGDAELGDIIADNESGTVDITAGGSISQKPDTAIRGDELKIEAEGDVEIDVFVNNIEINAGGDVDLDSGKSRLEIEYITAGGDVTINSKGDVVSGRDDGVIFGESEEVTSGNATDITAGGDVTIDADGNIGSVEEDLVIRADGEVSWSTEYGFGFVTVLRFGTSTDKLWDDPDNREYFVRREDGTLEKHLRPGTGLEVYGYGLEEAFLWVGTEQLREVLFRDAANQIRLKITVNGEAVFDYMVAIDRIIDKILEDGKRIPVIDRDIAGRHSGKDLTFRFYVGTEYDGLRYTIRIEHSGTVRETTGTVTDGYIIFHASNIPSSVSVDLIG